MTVYLAKHESPFGNTQNRDSIGTVILGLSDDPHLALRRATRKTKSIANYHSHFILEKNPDSLPVLPERRSLQLRRALGFDSLEFPLRGYDLHFAIRGTPAASRVLRKPAQIIASGSHDRRKGKKRASPSRRHD
jgi:hypothetical protein